MIAIAGVTKFLTPPCMTYSVDMLFASIGGADHCLQFQALSVFSARRSGRGGWEEWIEGCRRGRPELEFRALVGLE